MCSCVHADGTVLQTKHKTGSLTSTTGDGNSNVQVQVQSACMQHVLMVCRVCIVHVHDVAVCHVKEVYFSFYRE